jgi:6-pyruvoyltetrahydropterin/6-carboxytetrahydropterin synthase
MHKLSRQIRFAINPFADTAETGANSYCAKPSGEGLTLFFSLEVELKGIAKKETGFVLNVSNIDRIVREKGIGILDEFVKRKFKQKEQINFEQIAQVLARVWDKIGKEFLPDKIDGLTVELMPARKLGIKERQGKMLYYSEKFEFSASHTLWNKKFSDDKNSQVFGKCANKCGHGHNYIIEVTIKKPTKGKSLKAIEFEKIVEKELIRTVDHKNLNEDVGYFKKVNPTVENIAEFAFNKLAKKFKPFKLDCITVWETDRIFCSFRA